MAKHTEPLDRGLVNVRSSALLEPGQLSDLQNAVFRPEEKALRQPTGRTQFGAATATGLDVDGLRDAKFDNGNHYLIAHVTASYVSAAVGDTGTFGVLVSGVGDGSQLEVVHYRNRFFLFNGVSSDASAIGSNKAIYLSATAAANTLIARQHGMLPVRSGPRISTATGTFSQTVTGYYEYWTTEVARITQDGTQISLEGTFSSDSGPTTVFITATGQVPIIEQPTINNAITTHWRIYRSPKKEKESDKKFPSGFMIAEIATGAATTAIPDQTTTASASSFPTSYNTSAPFDGFSNRTNLGADDGAYASGTVGATFVPSVQAAYGFNFGGFVGSVKGIEIELQAYVPAGTTGVPLEATIGRRATDGSFLRRKGFGSTPPSKSAIITATGSGAPQTVTLGGSSDRWFGSDQHALADSDFDGNFMVTVGTSKLNTSIGVDYVKAKVYYQATVDSVIPFPTVAYTFGDTTAQVGKNGPPPSSSTGTLFEDCLVVNDVSNPSLIRYSYPGDPEAFPETYYIDFETRENDRVTNIKSVNGRLVAFLSTSSHRINYLPSERDASFDRGKATETISSSYGCVNEMCACVYSPAGGPDRIAFVSDIGIHSTDGFSFDTMTGNLNWRSFISITSTSEPIALIDDRENEELLFYYRNDSMASNETYKCLHIGYGSVDEGGLPVISGQVNMRNFNSGSSTRASLESAWAVRRSTGTTNIFLGYGGTATSAGAGFVYRENGTTLPAQDSSLAYLTRAMRLDGPGMEWRLDQMYGHLSTFSGTPSIIYTLLNSKTDQASEATTSTKTKNPASSGLHRVHFSQTLEGAKVSAVVTGHAAMGCTFLVLDYTSFGTEDSGR